MDLTLLIAEDNPELADLYQTYLERFGCRIIPASTALECLPVLRSTPIDMAIVSIDLLWGGAEGILDWLCSEALAGPLPEVILNGCRDGADVTHFQKWPLGRRYLQKPFSMAVLVERLRDIERRRCRNADACPVPL